jgi:hypothetical protein
MTLAVSLDELWDTVPRAVRRPPAKWLS